MRALAIPIVVSMAAVVGSVVGGAVPGIGVGTGMLIAALAASIGAGGWATGSSDPRARYLGLDVVATVAVPLVLVGGRLGATRGDIAGGVLLAVVIRVVTAATLSDLDAAHRRGDAGPGPAPVERLRRRVVLGGVALAALAAFDIGVEAGLSSLARPAAASPMWAVVAWFAIGLPSMAATAWSARRWRWSLDGVEVADGVSAGWAMGAALATVIVAAAMVALPTVTNGLSAVPAQQVGAVEGVGDWLTERLERFGDIGDPDGSVAAGEDSPAPAAPPPQLEPSGERRAEWAGDVALGVILAGIFALAIRAGARRRRRPVGGADGSGGEVGVRVWLTALVAEISAALRRLWAALRDGLGRSQTLAEPSVGRARRDGGAEWWSPHEPGARRVASAFRDLAELEPPRPGESPLAVARAVGARTDPQAARLVGRAYVRARYSSTVVHPGEASAVEDAARRVVEVSGVEVSGAEAAEPDPPDAE